MVMCRSVIKSTREWLEGILGYFKQPSPPHPPPPLLLLPPLWGKIEGGEPRRIGGLLLYHNDILW